ncbi:hypothetical protein [Vagococcus sp. WN89Y]
MHYEDYLPADGTKYHASPCDKSQEKEEKNQALQLIKYYEQYE